MSSSSSWVAWLPPKEKASANFLSSSSHLPNPLQKEGIPPLLSSLLFSCSLVTLTGELALCNGICYTRAFTKTPWLWQEKKRIQREQEDHISRFWIRIFWWRLCGYYCIEEEGDVDDDLPSFQSLALLWLQPNIWLSVTVSQQVDRTKCGIQTAFTHMTITTQLL